MPHGCTPRARDDARNPTATFPGRPLAARTLPVALSLALLGACASPPTSTPRPRVVESPIADAAANPRPSSPARRTRPVPVHDATLDALFARARDLVEAESGTDLASVTLRLVDDEAIVAEVSVETRRLVRGQLGDGPLATRLLGSLIHGQLGTYAALYSGRHRSIMVSRDVLASYLGSLPPTPAGRREEALLVLLLHELVHAADDLRHGIHANRTLDFRASFAQSAAFEGHAQWLTRAICRREGCLGGLDALDAFMFDERGVGTTGESGTLGGAGVRSAGPRIDGSADEPAAGESTDRESADRRPEARRPSPLDRNLLEYSYVEGERFVAALAERANGAALIERLLAEPPHDPLQILDPASYPDVTREADNQRLLSAARSVDHPWLTGPDARVPVATSPLKGVDLRNDPTRRAAAIDGFTRLVTAMVAVQFHDAGERARPPIEVTLMRTDRPDTARLFANTLHAHARLPDGTVVGEGSAVRRDGLLRTELPTREGEAWRTVVASAGRFVVQASGRTGSSAPIDAYVLEVLDALVAAEPA